MFSIICCVCFSWDFFTRIMILKLLFDFLNLVIILFKLDKLEACLKLLYQIICFYFVSVIDIWFTYWAPKLSSLQFQLVQVILSYLRSLEVKSRRLETKQKLSFWICALGSYYLINFSCDYWSLFFYFFYVLNKLHELTRLNKLCLSWREWIWDPTAWFEHKSLSGGGDCCTTKSEGLMDLWSWGMIKTDQNHHILDLRQ